MELNFNKIELAFCEAKYPMLLREDILNKVNSSLLITRNQLLDIHKTPSIFPENSDYVTGKISKGERYRGMPWMVLDFPRYNAGNDVMMFRVFFLWAEGFRVVLHISGKKLLDHFYPIALNQIPVNKNIEIAYQGELWQHHQENDYFEAFHPGLIEKSCPDFLKFCRFFPLSSLEDLPKNAVEFFMELNIYLSSS